MSNAFYTYLARWLERIHNSAVSFTGLGTGVYQQRLAAMTPIENFKRELAFRRTRFGEVGSIAGVAAGVIFKCSNRCYHGLKCAAALHTTRCEPDYCYVDAGCRGCNSIKSSKANSEH